MYKLSFTVAKMERVHPKVDSGKTGAIPFLFFFNSKSSLEIYHLLKRNEFDRPICWDPSDRINQLNHFPDEFAFQTFLLDENNRVIVVGNPIHNPNVQQLYLNHLGLLRDSLKQDIPTILQIDKQEYDLGVIEEGTVKELKVTIRNIGDKPFYMRGTSTSCDCTTVVCDWDMIPVDEDRVMSIRFTADEAGDYFRTISLFGNIPEKEIMIELTGRITKADNRHK